MNKSSQELIHPVLPIAIFLQRKGKYHETVTHMIILFSRLQKAFREFYLLFDMIILQANPRTEALFAFGQLFVVLIGHILTDNNESRFIYSLLY